LRILGVTCEFLSIIHSMGLPKIRIKRKPFRGKVLKKCL